MKETTADFSKIDFRVVRIHPLAKFIYRREMDIKISQRIDITGFEANLFFLLGYSVLGRQQWISPSLFL